MAKTTPDNPRQMRLNLAGPVTRLSTWQAMFGDNPPVRQARQRWARWLRIARKMGKKKHGRELARMWASPEGCVDDVGRCRHLRGRAWCGFQQLPASYNPILSERLGMPGMACMGMGKDPTDETGDDIFAERPDDGD